MSLSALAIGVGLVAGAGATAFVGVEHHLQHWLWDSLPHAMGQEQAPGWLVLALLLTGALAVYGASRLPGHGGHSPLAPLSLDIGPRQITSVALAALASLSVGAVLGPEAPLMAIGTALGSLAVRNPASPVKPAMMLIGAMAAVGAIFGNPLVSCVLLLELAVLAGPRVANLLVLGPALVGLASSYVLQVGFARWSGLGEAQLQLPGLEPYPTVRAVDLLAGVGVAVVASVLAMTARLSAMQIVEVARRAPLGTLLGSGAVVAFAGIGVDALTHGGLDLILFSGQSSMIDYLSLSAVGTVAIVLVGKFVAYVVSLGGGFRGGAVFPAVAMGVLVAGGVTQLVPGSSASALAAVGISAGTAAAVRMPFMALLLGAMLTFSAGGATTVLAVLGVIVGMAARLAGEQAAPRLAAGAH